MRQLEREILGLFRCFPAIYRDGVRSSTLAWGALTAVALWLIQPPLETLIARIPPVVTYLMLLVFTADVVCSVRILSVTHSVPALRGQT